MDPIDVVMSLITGLSEKEKQRVRQALGTGVTHPCAKLGHKYKQISKKPASWFRTGEAHFVCERCGHLSQVYGDFA